MTGKPYIPVLTRLSEYAYYHADRQPETEALVFGDQRIDYGEFTEQVKQLSRALLAHGIRHGDRIAMLGTPRSEFMILLMATIDIGAIWMGMHPRYQMREFAHVIDLASPKLVFAFSEIDGRDYRQELQTFSNQFDCIERIVLYPQAVEQTDNDIGQPFEQFIELAQQTEEADWLAARQAVKTDDPAVIIFTSGTTGQPKGAMNSHFGLIHGAQTERRHWPGHNVRVLQNMPINHIANIGMMSGYCLVEGGTLVFQDRFDPGILLSTIEKERITFWLQSPVQFHLAAAHADFDKTDFSSLQYMIWGGGPMPQHLVGKLYQLDARLATAYGMTELTAYATFSDTDADIETLASSIGRPEATYDLRLRKLDGSEVATGESGEIQARGRWLMRGYFNQPDATEEAYTNDGWFHTGDVAMLRPDGNWSLVGRTKEMYKSGGFNIYPREIEIVMEQHPSVALTAVLGVPDSLYDEVGHAFVQPVAGHSLQIDELRQWCKQRLANYKIPKVFEILEPLPTLPIGKIDKQALRKRLR